MPTQLKELISCFEEIWPLSGAESWDTPGLVTGNESQAVLKVLLTVDVTGEILNEAENGNYDLIFSHHPLLFKPVSSISQSSAKGKILAQAIAANIAIYSAHTNADVVESGVSAIIAKRLELKNSIPLSVSESSGGFAAGTNKGIGHGRIGELQEHVRLGDFARALARLIPATASGVRVSGDFNQQIIKVALCGGAGDAFINEAQEQGADVYITSDLRHHVTQEAREESFARKQPFALIDVSHWASEWLWLTQAADQLAGRFPELEITVSDVRTDPWDFVVTQ